MILPRFTRPYTSNIFRLCSALLLLLSLYTPALAIDDEVVAEVNGLEVYGNQLAGLEGEGVHAELYQFLVEPLLAVYCLKIHDKIYPQPAEIEKFMAYHEFRHDLELKEGKNKIQRRMAELLAELEKKDLDEAAKDAIVGELYYLRSELEPPGEEYAMFILPHWKTQLYLYREYGGGRLLWQERGYMAFDATYAWLKKQEETGNLKFHDPSLKKTFYKFWKTKDHGQKLISNKKQIEQEFLQPPWTRFKR